MRDALGRNIDYMRISITDRCNLRCKYCMPENLPDIPHSDILRYEEILRICKIAAGFGIRKFKVTGGEPFVRKDCIQFLRNLKELSGVDYVTVTSNGVLLEPYIGELVKIGIDGVNISLDSIKTDMYKEITGKDEFGKVWNSIHRAIEAGLKVKLNCVLIRELNRQESVSLARLAEILPVDVRFIELMPTEHGKNVKRVRGREILEELKFAYPSLAPDQSKRGFGPAQYYKIDGFRGSIGFIDVVSNRFCGDCNRIRLTCEGFLKLCLCHDDGIDLSQLLRGGVSDLEISTAMSDAIFRKPERHFLSDGIGANIGNMSRIGG